MISYNAIVREIEARDDAAPANLTNQDMKKIATIIETHDDRLNLHIQLIIGLILTIAGLIFWQVIQ